MLCLVLLQVPKTFVTVQIFWARPKVWLHLVTLQKLLCWHKNGIYSMKIIFWCGSRCLWPAQYVCQVLVWHKKFGTGTICKSILFWKKQIGPAQTILGPVKGQGIRKLFKMLLSHNSVKFFTHFSTLFHSFVMILHAKNEKLQKSWTKNNK